MVASDHVKKPQQLKLSLSRSRNPSGRTPGPHPLVLHRRREKFRVPHACHVTLRVRPGLPSLRERVVVREVEAAFRRGREPSP
jgi:hypothetical protein